MRTVVGSPSGGDMGSNFTLLHALPQLLNYFKLKMIMGNADFLGYLNELY